jgi:HD superfamily phosphohydrolase YqeK
MTNERRAHVERVAWLLSRWADAMAIGNVERARWLRAAALHDALKDASSDVLRELVPDGWDIEALRHGPAAAVMVARHGERDPGILNAVRYHSVGCADWERVGSMLYLADYLDPGRGGSREGLTELASQVPADPQPALVEVARRRIEHEIRRGRRLLPETVRFWNALVCDA